jgi:hypothetical protein
MDYTKKSCKELIAFCKENGINGYSGKKRETIIEVIRAHTTTHQKQDTGKYRTNTKDQFYTKESIAKDCIRRIIQSVPITKHYLWIEPSAGNGSFLHNIPASFEKIGLDIEPMATDICKQDYLLWTPPTTTNKDIIVFGNPPFGRQSTIAKSFITKSCKFANVIAFILPKSFTKPSMYNVFDSKFHMIESVELEKNSFVINGAKYDVPCVFQIWQRKDIDRNKDEKVQPNGFQYVKATDNYDVAFRRVGALAGKCYKYDGTKVFSIQSHYFLKFDDIILSMNTAVVDIIMEKINTHVFPSNTVGPRSLSKTEVNIVINDYLEQSRFISANDA